MHHHTITLPAPLSGIRRAAGADTVTALPAPLPVAEAASPLAARRQEPRKSNEDSQEVKLLATELTRLFHDLRSQHHDRHGEIARMSVELGAAIAERLIGAEIAANRQRLDGVVLAALERMAAARFVVVRGHADDLALLERQLAEHADMDRYRDMLTFRRDEACVRGRLKLEADEWFIDFDTDRGLTDLRAALLEETFMDDD